VRGTIDWERRFDHMQQHTGQHLLSAGFVRLLDAPTVSFHLGTDDSTIDLDTPELSWDSAFRVEADVNSVIWEDRPVEVHTVDQEDIHTVPLRRPPQVNGTIRVVWVRDYDAAACGGTHVVRTGAIGLLKITRIERYKSGVRVGFLCGGRALRHYQRSLLHLQSASTSLSVHPDQLGEAIQRLQDDLRETRRASRAAQNAVMAFEAQRLWTDTPEVGGVRRVVEFLDDRSYDEARAAASHLSNQPRTLALLAVNDAKGVRMVCERSCDIPNLDAASILLRAAEALGGRAGGTASLAQGGAPARARDVVVEALRAAAASAR
jgi:alanyl-tRNA synthetase